MTSRLRRPFRTTGAVALSVGTLVGTVVVGVNALPGTANAAVDLSPTGWEAIYPSGDSEPEVLYEVPPTNGDSSHLQAAVPGTDAGWDGEGLDQESIGFEANSLLEGDAGDCPSGDDGIPVYYYFFQNFIEVPADFTGPFAVGFSDVDDGARVSISEADDETPDDLSPASYVTREHPITGDLSSLLTPGTTNRVVVTLVDDCPDHVVLTGARFLTAENSQCEPGQTCLATTEGTENRFSVTATGGQTSPTLYAIPNGGQAPECGLPTGSDLELAPDWVQFGFDPPSAGETWTKQVAITSLDELTEEEANAALADQEVCFTAPYTFETKDGFPALAGGPAGLGDFYGILPDCVEGGGPGPGPDNKYGPFGPYGPYEGFGAYGPYGPYGPGTGQAPPSSPSPAGGGTTGPCVTGRTVVPGATVGTFVTQITFKVPAGEQDPQGRSCRKKKRR